MQEIETKICEYCKLDIPVIHNKFLTHGEVFTGQCDGSGKSFIEAKLSVVFTKALAETLDK